MVITLQRRTDLQMLEWSSQFSVLTAHLRPVSPLAQAAAPANQNMANIAVIRKSILGFLLFTSWYIEGRNT